MLSSTASIINLRNGGILDFNHSNNPNGKNGLVVDKFTSDDGVIILNSDTNDQYFQIATSASGNVLYKMKVRLMPEDFTEANHSFII